jgi:hypothetical protein
MESIVIMSIFIVFGACIYFAIDYWISRSKNGERRSGNDRRKTFDASKNKMRRSGRDRRALGNIPVSVT